MLIFSALRGLSPGAPVFPSPEKPNANSLWKSSPINDTGDTHRATSLSVLRSVKCTPLRHLLLLLFFSSIVSAKIVFCLWTWPGCIRGLQILDKTGGKIIYPPPHPQSRMKKTWCISSFFYCCLSKKCFQAVDLARLIVSGDYTSWTE